MFESLIKSSYRNKILQLIFIIFMLTILSLMPYFMNGYIRSLLINLFMFIALTESWSIFSATTGYINFAVAAFFGLGMYTTAILWESCNVYFCIFAGGAVAAMLALLIGLITLRIKGPYFIMVTFALGEFLKQVIQFYESNVTHRLSRLVPVIDEVLIYYINMSLMAITILTYYLIRSTRIGKALMCIRDNEVAAEVIGINTLTYKVLAIAVSSLFMGSIGAIMAYRWNYIHPLTAFNPLITFQVIIMAYLGGINTVAGPAIGATILLLLSEALWASYPYHYLILLGLLLIIIVIFTPNGLIGRVSGRHL